MVDLRSAVAGGPIAACLVVDVLRVRGRLEGGVLWKCGGVWCVWGRVGSFHHDLVGGVLGEGRLLRC